MSNPMRPRSLVDADAGGPNAGPSPGYSPIMVGPGRWVLLETATELHGVLWTDEGEALGVVPIEGTVPDAHARLMGGIAACAAKGIPALEVYLSLARSYAADPEYRGQLENLLYEL